MIGFISEKLLIPILDFFYGLVPSYGLAIVALTVVIRIALFPLSAGSIRSARRMKIAQPVMQKRQAEIKSKFSSDPKKQQEELGKLMNEFGSPLAGWLPLFREKQKFIEENMIKRSQTLNLNEVEGFATKSWLN